jgi:hypothetical protein
VVVSGVGDINGDGFNDVMVGSGYDFSGTGYIVRYPAVYRPPSAAPCTVTPSSAVPSVDPSHRPTTSTPSAPSSQPSVKPSEPTFTPSVRPSQPTSQPTSVPSRPTCRPSEVMTITPTLKPTTQTPSTTPIRHTIIPSTIAPSLTQIISTITPTIIITTMPTRYPVVRPSVAPSMPPTTLQFVTVIADTPGLYVRNVTHSVYIVNSTGSVRIILRDNSANERVGNVRFIVHPNAHSLLIIDSFNITSDVIDMTAFTGVYSSEDMVISEFISRWRRLRANENKKSQQVSISMTNSQTIQILNITDAHHVAVDNIRFIFAPRPSSITDEKSSGVGPLIAGCVIAGMLILFILYRSGVLYHQHKSHHKSTNIDWDAVSRTNPSYISFNSQDSWMSEDSALSRFLSDISVSTDSSECESPADSTSSSHSVKSGEDSKSDVDEDLVLSSRNIGVFNLNYAFPNHVSDVVREEEEEEENWSISDDENSMNQYNLGAADYSSSEECPSPAGSSIDTI